MNTALQLPLEPSIKEISNFMKHTMSLQKSSAMKIECLMTTFSIVVEI